MAALAVNGTVATVTDRRTFTATLGNSPQSTPQYFEGGMLEFTSGANAGYAKEVKLDSTGSPLVLGTFVLWEPMPLDIQVGDTFEIRPGCNKSKDTCKTKFNNVVNFRGYGVFVPGMNEVLRGPDRPPGG